MNKAVSIVAFTAILISGFMLVGSVHFGVAQNSTPVSGVINSDTTWTRANSPYNLNGNVLVNSGVTLAIQAGVIINLNANYIEVNGTLVARGTSNNRILFNNGVVDFTQFSSPWNQNSGGGNIIEYSVFSGFSKPLTISIQGSPLLSQNDINCLIQVSMGSPIISSNNITALYYNAGHPSSAIYGIDIVTKNEQDSPMVSGNTISGPYEQAAIEIQAGNPIIQGNVITGSQNGIDMTYATWTINATIENNAISYCRQNGIALSNSYVSTAIIQNNTITNCGINAITISGNKPSLYIAYNNFASNSGYNLYWQNSNNLYAFNNWWGTTDIQAINQTIYDFKNDFNLGTVTFIPYLNAPNPEAPTVPIPTATPTPNPSPSPSPISSLSSTPSPSIPEFPSWITLPILTATLLSVALIRRKVTKKQK